MILIMKKTRENIEKVTKSITTDGKIPKKYLKDIEQKYGSFESFADKYKKGEVDYSFGKGAFCGYRGVTISSRELTETQKLAYATFAEDIIKADSNKEKQGTSFEDGDYIEIDNVIGYIDTLTDKERKIIEIHYGIGCEKLSYSQIGEMFGVSKSRVQQIINKIIEDAKNSIKPVRNLKNEIQECDAKQANIEECKRDLKALIAYITDESGSIKSNKNIKNVRLEDLGFCNEHNYNADRDVLIDLLGMTRKNDIIDLYDILKEIGQDSDEDFNKRIDSNLNVKVEELQLPNEIYLKLKRNGLNYTSDIVSLREKNIRKIRGLGNQLFDLLKQKLAEKGLNIRQEEDFETIFEKREYSDGIIEKLFERCNALLEKYNEKVEEAKKSKSSIREIYDIAKENYLTKEDIFNPEGIVPAVVLTKENVDYKDEQKNDEGNGNDEIDSSEDKTILETEQEDKPIQDETERRKQELKESIIAKQQELRELKKELSRVDDELEL